MTNEQRYECIYPSLNIEVDDPNPPQDFLKKIYDYFYKGTDCDGFVKWIATQPTIWVNHPDTIKTASEGNSARYSRDPKIFDN